MSDTPELMVAGSLSAVEFDTPRQCWRVTGGQLDVFAVPVNDAGEQVDTGRFLFTLEPDQIGFGIAPCPLADGRRLAIRVKGRWSSGKCEPLQAAFDDDRQWMVEAVDRWLIQLAGCLSGDASPDVIASPGQKGQQAGAGARIGVPPDLLLWIGLQGGSVQFLGREAAAPVFSGEPPIPVSPGHWALALEPTAFSAWTTAELMRGDAGRGAFWQAFDRANSRLLALVADDFSKERARERARIAERLRQSSVAFVEGIRQARTVFGSNALAGELGAEDDPLFAAARVVATHQRVTLKRIRYGNITDPLEQLAAICRASRIDVQPVTLERNWFRHDNGPLLGFADAGNGALRPLALLPRQASGYEAVDPDRGERYEIGPQEAAVLLPTAYMFYRAFHPSPVTMRGLINFALAGLGRDLRRILVMGLLGGLLSLVLPLISYPLFNTVLPHAIMRGLITLVLALGIAALGSAAFELVRSFSLLRVEGRVEASVQAATWDRLLRLPAGFFRNYTTGDLADRVMNMTMVRSFITLSIGNSVLDAMFSLISFVLMFWYSWRLALVATGLAIIAVLLTVALTALQLPHQRALMRDMGEVSGLTHQLVTAIGKVRIAGAEGRAFGRWASILAQQKEHAFRARRIAAAQHTLVQSFPPITSIVLYITLIKLGESVPGSEKNIPLLTIAEYMAFNAAFGQFISALMSVVSAVISLVTIVPLYERVRPLLSSVPETRDGAQPPGVLSGDIEFRNVVFRYESDTPPVLDDLSFHVQPGEYIALVGPSGSGKSTIVRLALGFEIAQSGSVLFDRKDISMLDLGELRRQIGVVTQNAGLLSGSLYENIVGSQPISMDEAWDAVRLAGLEADIKAMPMGLHTVISDSAPMLSGGQRQRLIIARALTRNPRILIFDEATSALDNRTQEVVIETIARLNVTRIVIAHRLSTVRKVDRILVLERGHIVETGTYDELLAQKGLFSELVKQQML